MQLQHVTYAGRTYKAYTSGYECEPPYQSIHWSCFLLKVSPIAQNPLVNDM